MTNHGSGPAALALRLAGTSYADIAETLALRDARSAMITVQRELGLRVPDDDAKARMRAEEGERLLLVVPALIDKATDPHHPEHIAAVRALVTVVDRRIRLYGLDAPTEITVHTPTQGELDAWVASMAAGMMPAVTEPDILDVESTEVAEIGSG